MARKLTFALALLILVVAILVATYVVNRGSARSESQLGTDRLVVSGEEIGALDLQSGSDGLLVYEEQNLHGLLLR